MHPVAGALDHQLLTHFVDEEKLVVLVDGLEFAVRGLPGLPLDPSAVYLQTTPEVRPESM